MNKVQRYVKSRQDDRPQDDGLKPSEQMALDKIRSEAKQHKATLNSGGKGGLPPSLVLGVFRRDEWRCKLCGGNQDLSVHHKSGTKNLVTTALRKRGHTNDPNNLVTICNRDHDRIHNLDREVGEGLAVEKPAKKN